MPLLVLFDVDGTLFLTDDPLAGQAMRETLARGSESSLPEDAVERVDHLGQTSLRIARLVLGKPPAFARPPSTLDYEAGARPLASVISNCLPAPIRAGGSRPPAPAPR